LIYPQTEQDTDCLQFVHGVCLTYENVDKLLQSMTAKVDL